jgi:hypothetical protein
MLIRCEQGCNQRAPARRSYTRCSSFPQTGRMPGGSVGAEVAKRATSFIPRPTEPPISGAANVWPPSPLCKLLSPRRNTCRVSNSLSGFVPDLQASAGRYSHRHAFDSGRWPSQRLDRSCPAACGRHISVMHLPMPNGLSGCASGCAYGVHSSFFRVPLRHRLLAPLPPRSGGVEHPHDTPPHPFMPSPTFAHSSFTIPSTSSGKNLNM